MLKLHLSSAKALAVETTDGPSDMALPAWRTGLLLAGLTAAMAMPGWRAEAHDAPSGWSYPYSCCTNHDCRPVAIKSVSEKPQGYVINVTGEVVPYQDTRVRNSPDGDFHWCSVAGKDNTRTICLFVPPRAF